MKKLLLPIVLLLVGTGAGAGAGFLLKPEPAAEGDLAAEAAIHCEPTDVPVDGLKADATEEAAADEEIVERAYAKLNNQFVVPIVTDTEVSAIMALSLTIEVAEGDQEVIYGSEPKLRDVFLQVMFDHANTGGFSGNFTTGTNMRNLRKELLQAAQKVVGPTAIDILILDIVRQET